MKGQEFHSIKGRLTGRHRQPAILRQAAVFGVVTPPHQKQTQGEGFQHSYQPAYTTRELADAIVHACERHDQDEAIKGEQSLWRAVITQALQDALSASKKTEMAYDRHQAKAWLRGTTADFIDVCLMAGLDPFRIRHYAARALRQGVNLSELQRKLGPSPQALRIRPAMVKNAIEIKSFQTLAFVCA